MNIVFENDALGWKCYPEVQMSPVPDQLKDQKCHLKATQYILKTVYMKDTKFDPIIYTLKYQYNSDEIQVTFIFFIHSGIFQISCKEHVKSTQDIKDTVVH